MPGVSVNVNASSANVWKFIVEIASACMNDAATRPTMPPIAPSSSASTRNATRIAVREKPSARSVPISAVREATLAYIVIIAPITAPIEKMTEIVVPEVADELRQHLRLVGVEARLALGLERQPRVGFDLAPSPRRSDRCRRA